jgi:hypothetical protein
MTMTVAATAIIVAVTVTLVPVVAVVVSIRLGDHEVARLDHDRSSIMATMMVVMVMIKAGIKSN